MKITDIKVLLTAPAGRNFVLVKVLTDEGVYGCGEGTLNGNEPVVAKAIEHMTPLLLGMDPLRTEDIWQFIYHWPYFRGGPVYAAAQGAIDLALWDLKGKVAGLPVYQLLGGRSRRGAMVYRHADGRDVKEAADNVRKFLDQGIRSSASSRARTAVPARSALNRPRSRTFRPWRFSSRTCISPPSSSSSRGCARSWATTSSSATTCTSG